MTTIPNHDPEDKLPTYVQNILDGKSKTNFGKMPINDGTTPARTLLASYATKNRMRSLVDSKGANIWVILI